MRTKEFMPNVLAIVILLHAQWAQGNHSKKTSVTQRAHRGLCRRRTNVLHLWNNLHRSIPTGTGIYSAFDQNPCRSPRCSGGYYWWRIFLRLSPHYHLFENTPELQVIGEESEAEKYRKGESHYAIQPSAARVRTNANVFDRQLRKEKMWSLENN